MKPESHVGTAGPGCGGSLPVSGFSSGGWSRRRGTVPFELSLVSGDSRRALKPAPYRRDDVTLWHTVRSQPCLHPKMSRTGWRASNVKRKRSMPAQTPEEICSLFKRYMAEGDLESLLNIYDAEAVFLNESGEVRRVRRRSKNSWPQWPRPKQPPISISSRSSVPGKSR